MLNLALFVVLKIENVYFQEFENTDFKNGSEN